MKKLLITLALVFSFSRSVFAEIEKEDIKSSLEGFLEGFEEQVSGKTFLDILKPYKECLESIDNPSLRDEKCGEYFEMWPKGKFLLDSLLDEQGILKEYSGDKQQFILDVLKLSAIFMDTSDLDEPRFIMMNLDL